MTETEINPLSSKEYDEVGLAIFERISQFDGLPDGVKLDYQKLDGTGRIGFYTSPGGKYIQEYVTGGFLAQLPFDLVYRFNATSNQQLLDAEKIMDKLADYLQERPYPSLTGGREVEEITMNSITYRTKAEDDGSVQFARSGVLRYEKI
jgi:hypothetical protein